MSLINNIKHFVNSVSRTTFYLTIILFLLIDAAIFIIYLKSSAISKNKNKSNFENFQYGDFLSRDEIIKLVSLPTKYESNKILIAFPSQAKTTFLRELAYLDLLYQMYHKHGLSIIPIIKTTEPDLIGRYKKRLNLSIPLINDTMGNISNYFNIRNNSGGLLFIDSTDTIRFVLSSFLDEHITRKLVESEILGYNKIAFSKYEFDNQLKPSTDSSSMTLYDLINNKEKRLKDILTNRPVLLTLVDPMSSFCKSESPRIKTLNKLSGLLRDKIDIFLIYKTSESYIKITKYLNENEFQGQSFATPDHLLKVSEYCTNLTQKKPMTSVLVSSAGFVDYVESIDDNEDELMNKIRKIISTHYQ